MTALRPRQAFFFTPGLAPDLVQKRYRALVRVLHPDVETGDTRLMQELNLEYEAFERGALLPPSPEQAAAPPPGPFMSHIEELRRQLEREIARLPSLRGAWFDADPLMRRIWARGETYEHRDLLKSLRFRWEPVRKAWYREVQL